MMINHFIEAEKAVHYPADRRAFIAIKPYMLIIFCMIALGFIGLAWLQYLFIGVPTSISSVGITGNGPVGFSLWVSLSHWVNFFF